MKLYHFQSCPYCSYVRDEFQKMGLVSGKDYELIEASRGTPGREKVIQLGGKSQVPFLVDGDTRMYESRDIVEYVKLKKKF
ncbi:glutathione S-transferase N-terminal domain-containing protein [Leptospira interrogans]|uniref:Glutaredoxin n=2 Tax=Leptospira interrogans TaxID=173 RepID=A0A0F6I8J2_LEPIR|nr:MULTISPECIES: glutathione S-transferase N-terminal domain-containing protein [Leptospira]EJO76643.1 glutaredoxin [Leptospira interrogans serovar Pomona str. Kennewicki LC82-25]EKN99487.1 glutaredoxin [Leptospira interrogans serovar Pomona str. Pomona]EKR34936.1 glutaredoxin [Leptospira interrogans serovar Hebdomadis str. R499]EMF34259.1 glutaredoxin [Leptospira interrogans serovar Pomona str. Fox 32256]EMI70907.1 glutaredoxin [Leptospira interrogans serovar Pomona str. CSL10083]